MKVILKAFFLKHPDNRRFWISIAFLFKGVLFLLLLMKHLPIELDGFIGETTSDSPSYINPIDSLLATGHYTPDYRMPGYGIFYFLLILFFSKANALNLLLISQYILASLSIYPLALIAKSVFKSTASFYLTFYLFAISTYTNLYDATILTESFSVSFLIFSVFYLLSYFEEKRTKHLIYSGLFLTGIVFLRPVFLPFFILFSGVFLIYYFKSKRYYKNLVYFLLPFIIIDGAWMVRNYSHYHKLIPLTKTVWTPGFETSIYKPTFEFIQSWGGNYIWWDPTSEARWFGINDHTITRNNKIKNENVTIPNYIYTSKFNLDSLIILKQKITAVRDDSTLSSTTKAECEKYIKQKTTHYTQSIIKEKPFLYYVKAPLILTKKFLIHSGTYNLFSKPSNSLNIFEFLVKLFYSLFYISVLSLGFIGIIFSIKDTLKFPFIGILSGIVFYTIIIHTAILRMPEIRYFLPAFPFLIVFSTYGLIKTIALFKTNKS